MNSKKKSFKSFEKLACNLGCNPGLHPSHSKLELQKSRRMAAITLYILSVPWKSLILFSRLVRNATRNISRGAQKNVTPSLTIGRGWAKNNTMHPLS